MRVAETDNTNHQHVGVVPVARPGVLLVAVLAGENAAQTAPIVLNVAGGAPAVAADRRAPGPDIAHPVLTKAVEDVPVGTLEGLPHDAVGLHLPLQSRAGCNIAVGTPVVFQVIDAPGGVDVGVLLFVLPASGVIAAGFGSGRGIDADFQPLAMDITGEGFHAGKLRVGLNDPGGIAARFPGIIDVDILEPVRGQTGGDQLVGSIADFLRVDYPGPDVPRVPAQRRGQSQRVGAADDGEDAARRALRPAHGQDRTGRPGAAERTRDDSGRFVEDKPRRQVFNGILQRPASGGGDEKQKGVAGGRTDQARAVQGGDRRVRPHEDRHCRLGGNHFGQGDRLHRRPGGERQPGIGPIGMVTVDPVAAVGHDQRQPLRPGDVQGDGYGLVAAAQHRRFELLFAVDIDRERQ